MEELKVLYTRLLIVLVFSIVGCHGSMIWAQGNCLQFPENSGERKACEMCHENEYKQGSRASLMLFDSAIAIGPKYPWVYYQKSVAYLKRGMLTEGMSLLNKAVALDPQSHICYRAYWYYSHKSYQACIDDLELYYSTYGGYIEFTPGGEHEMRMLLGMSYAALGELDKATNVIADYLNNPKNDMHIRAEDFYVLGVLYYRNGQLEKAKETLNKQIAFTPSFADAYYYLGKVKEELSDVDGATNAYAMAKGRYEGKDGGYSKKVLGIVAGY